MIGTHQTNISKDASGKKLLITRQFNAPADKVWRAFTESDLLDKWWAPRPWRAVTRTMDFSEGGHWLYAMTSPEGQAHWCKVIFSDIDAPKSFKSVAAFCDEEGNITQAAPPMYWYTQFAASGSGTLVTVEIRFDTEADLQQIVEMGFKEGFTMAVGNLDELLAAA